MKVNVPNKSEGSGEWELHPAGTFPGVLVDVIDLGEVEQDVFGKPGERVKVHQVKLAFQTNKKMTSGKPFMISTWGMKVSLHEKAKLRKFAVALNGGAEFAEGADVDLDAFIGANCLVNVIHKKSADGTKTYANLGGILPPMDGMPQIAPTDYVRVQDRPASEQANDEITNPNFDDDSSIPF